MSDFDGVGAEPGLQITVGPFLFRVRSSIPSVRAHLERFYCDYPLRCSAESHFDVTVVPARRARGRFRAESDLYINGLQPFNPLPVHLSGPSVEWALNWSVGGGAHRWVMLHAAVVERNGRVVVMPAPPGSGKSTLCTALAFSGWRLFSDEFTLLDPDSSDIVPAPRPISLKETSIDVIARRYPEAVRSSELIDTEGTRFVHVRPQQDSIARAAERAVPGWIVFPKYTAGAPTSLKPLSKADTLMLISAQSFNQNYLGVRGFRALERLVRASDCYNLEYSDLDDVLPRLEGLTRF